MERDKIKQDYILITSSNFPLGGAAANYLNLFCRGLILNGCSIRVLLLKGFAFGSFKNEGSRQNVTEYGVPYTYLSLTLRSQNQILKFFDEIISFSRLNAFLFSILNKRKSISLLIYNNELHSNIPIYLIAKLFRIRIISFVPEFYDKSVFDGSFFRKIKWYGFIINFYYLNKISNKLIVFSHFLKEEYIKQGFNGANIIIQPNLTDFEYWITKETKIKYMIGYSGTPSVKDGLYDLFRAIKLLQNEDFHVSLLVIGDSTFGKSLIPELKIECQKLGILVKVTFTGLVELSKVREYLSECRILAITRPSKIQTKAGFPTKLGEYFAIKKPILATDFGDIKKYFLDGIDLVIAESDNPQSIAEEIKWMLENSKELELITRKGYDKAKQLLEYNNSVNRMINFLGFK